MKISDNIQNSDFFILLRAGLWQKCVAGAKPDWGGIFRLACDQTVHGIVADGAAICKAEHPELPVIPQVFDELLNQSAQIVRQNYSVNQMQARVCAMMADAGIKYVVLKGQGVAQSYPKPMLRCSGDIDLFFTPQDYERAKLLLKPLSASIEDKPATLECALNIDGVDIELHGAMTAGISKAADKHLQLMLHKVLEEGDTRSITVNGQQVMLPSANFDAIYVLTHAIRHLGAFGISLRQVIDWAMHVHANAAVIDRQRLQRDIEAMHLARLWRLFSAFAVEYLGLPAEDFEVGSCSAATVDPTQTSATETTVDPALTAELWTIIRASGSFGRKNPYFKHLHAGRLNERFARIYYRTKQAFKIRHFDREFSNYLLRNEAIDVVVAPFRFLSGRKTKITE